MSDRDTPELLEPGRWRMWAVAVPSPPYAQPFYEPGHRRYAEAFVSKNQSVVEVLVVEDENGPYYGWVWIDEEIPTMIHPSLGLFRMCFPYGPEIEEEKGKGRIVHLTITEWENR